MPLELRPGVVLAQRYRLERPIGEGGMGIVWAAKHVLTEKSVALKFLRDGTGGERIKRFMLEARISGTLRHPNIVEVHDVLELDGGTPVMVMDLLSGESLESKLNREGALRLPVTADVLLPVVSAVGSAHARGVVHRDLKPDNIFLSQSAAGLVEVKVLDFGIAKLTPTDGAAARTAMTQTGQVMGTPYYMSPEQVFGERGIDHRADLWALGIILYECLSGRRPIGGENYGQIFKAITMGEIVPIQTLVPALPGNVTSLIGRLLVRDKSARLADARDVFEVLRVHASVGAQSFGAVRAAMPSAPPASGPSSGPASGAGADAIDPFAHTEARSERARVSVEPGVDPHTPTFAAPSSRSGPIESGMGHVRTARSPAPTSRGLAIAGGLLAVLAVAGGATLVALRVRHAATVAPSSAGATVSIVEPAPSPSASGLAAAVEPTQTSTPTSASASASAAAAIPRVPVVPRAAAPAKPPPQPPALTATTAEKRKLPGGVAPESPY